MPAISRHLHCTWAADGLQSGHNAAFGLQLFGRDREALQAWSAIIDGLECHSYCPDVRPKSNSPI